MSSSGNLAGCRVFMIEDESLVAMLLQDLLDDIGCEVVGTAFRFSDAVEKSDALSFDVAILDVNLNGQQTFPIAERLADRGVPFVFATGYGAETLPPPLRNAPVLQKPFQRGDLERALRAAISETST